MIKRETSEYLFKQALNVIPGGVNSPVRAFGSVGGKPPFIKYGAGAEIFDVDGNSFIDYVLSWGPLILGHAHPEVVKALRNTAAGGTSFGAPIEREIQLAELITKRVKSVEKLRLVNSGTEATMSAVRLARAFTGRSKIIKFDGCYHGHSDGFLTKAGSGMMTAGIPTSPGVPPEITALTISVPYNDLPAAQAVFAEQGEQIAAVIVEPVAANMGVIPPVNGFLEGLRNECDKYDSLLIFDEVITGFRVARGGAQELYTISPDLTCFGKVIGGGLPVGAIGGPSKFMDKLAPVGDVYQAGTLSGNPLAVTAGLTTLKVLGDYSVYQKLEKAAKMLEDSMKENLKETGIPGVVQRVGSVMTLFFTDKQVNNYDDAAACDGRMYSRYFHSMLNDGIYLAPSAFEAMFLSTAHTEEQLQRTITIQRGVLNSLK